MKVIIITPHFGKWPAWINYFFQSCRANPSFSWLIYTDCSPLPETPPNVKFLKSSIKDFNKLASKKLGLKISIDNPYKVCDLRPAFGKIFEDFIKDFDFWGYSDLDLIYGNIGRFLSLDILQLYDVISVREQYMTGHFALIRNASQTNTLFKDYPKYYKIFEESYRHYAFDERSNIFGRRLFQTNNLKHFNTLYSSFELISNKLRFKFFHKTKINLNDFTRITENAAKNNSIKLFRKNMVRSDLWFLKKGIKNWNIEWDKGKLTDSYDGEELLHFHLIKSKYHKKFIVSNWVKNNRFVITEKYVSIPD